MCALTGHFDLNIQLIADGMCSVVYFLLVSNYYFLIDASDLCGYVLVL